MSIQDIMTKEVTVCTADTNAAQAAELMWNHDCGFLPVVEDDTGRLIGIVTDRDLFIALGTRGLRAADLGVRDVMQTEVLTCSSESRLRTALNVIATYQLHRLPVVNEEKALTGILSLHDIILYSKHRENGTGVSYDDIVRALMLIGRRGPRKHIEKSALLGRGSAQQATA